jgi:hypothetical protein
MVTNHIRDILCLATEHGNFCIYPTVFENHYQIISMENSLKIPVHNTSYVTVYQSLISFTLKNCFPAQSVNFL